MRKLEVSRQSKLELIEIREYTTARWGQQQSNKYLTGLYTTIVLLQKKPLIGTNRIELSDEIYSFPYVSHMIYYNFDDEKLYIMAVLHKSMLPKEQLLGRL